MSSSSGVVGQLHLDVAMAEQAPRVSACSMIRNRRHGPSLTRGGDGRLFCHYPGFCNEILGYLLEKLNVSFTLNPVKKDAKGNFGEPGDGGGNAERGWSGLLGDLQSGRYDAISTCFSTEDQPQLQRDFLPTNPVVYISSGFVYKSALNANDDFFALFKVFSSELWAWVFGLSLGIILMMAVNDLALTPKQRAIKKNIVSYLSGASWTVASFVTDQCHENPDEFEKNTITFRTLLSVLGLKAVFVLTLYESGLLSALIKEGTIKPFTSTATLAPLIAKDDYTLVAQEGNPYLATVKKGAEQGQVVMQEMQANLDRYGYTKVPITTDWNQTFYQIENGRRLVSPISEIDAAQHLAEYCQLSWVEDPDVPSVKLSFVFRKDQSELVRRMNTAINQELSYLSFITSRYTQRGGRYPTACLKVHRLKSLEVENYFALFASLGFGIAVGAVCFFGELLGRRRVDQQPPDDPLRTDQKSAQTGTRRSAADGKKGGDGPRRGYPASNDFVSNEPKPAKPRGMFSEYGEYLKKF